MKTLTAIIGAAALVMACSAGAQAEITKNYGDVTLNAGWDTLHFDDVWDLTQDDLTLTYRIDLSAVTQTGAGETPYIEVGLREVGAADFNPGPANTYQGGAGGWMTSLVGDLATNPNDLDLDDKHNLSASSQRGEGDYDVYASTPTSVESSPFGSFDSHGFWYDRDGHDGYQDDTITNTGGTYDITIVYRAIDSELGTMIATINGSGTDVDQEFRVSGDTYTGSTGLSFKGDMTQMQVFAGGWWTTGAGGDVQLTDITATGVPEPATMSLLGLGALALIRRRRK